MRAFAPTLLLGLLATACGDPTGSSTAPTVLTRGQEAGGKVGPGDTAWYEHRAGASEAFSVILRVSDGTVSTTVRDAAGHEVVPEITAGYAPPAVGESRTSEIVPPGPTNYRLVVTGAGRFKIQIEPTGSPPEHASPEIVANTTITETIDGPGDVDDFFLHGGRGDVLIASLQAQSPGDTRELRLEITSGGFVGSITAASTSRDTALDSQTTGRFVRQSPKPYRFRFTGPYVGAYRFQVVKVNLEPETEPQAAAENTPIAGERLDYLGDIDEFVIRGPVGTEYNVMFRLANGDPQSTAQVDISGVGIDPSGFNVTSSGRDSVLADQATGRFALGTSGTAKVRVQGIGRARGPYEILVYRIDPAPEGAKRALVPSDSVSTEAIEFPGDVDEFALDLATSDTLNLVLIPEPTTRWSSPTVTPLEARILTTSGQIVARTSALGEVAVGSGSVPLAAGRYRVQVVTVADRVNGYRGPYRLAAYQLRSRPENGNGTLPIGVIAADVIDPAGDTDTYEIAGTRGDHIDIRFQALEPSGFDRLLTLFLRARDNLLLASTHSGLAPLLDLGQVGSGRITIDETGPYLIAVMSANNGRLASERGGYRTMVRRYPAAPERHAPRLVAGDVVTDEAIDELGDVDEFSLEGPPGTDVAVYITAPPGPGIVSVDLVDPVTKEVLRSIGSGGWFQSLGRVVLPPSGRWLLRVAEPRSPTPHALPFLRTGGYRLAIQPINRAPELHAAAIAIGDTVSDESFDPVGDIDEFTFAGTQGQRLVGLFAPLFGLTPPGLALEVIVPASGVVLASVSAYNLTPTFGETRTATFTLPATGTYLVRVRGLDEFTTQFGLYRFAIVAD